MSQASEAGTGPCKAGRTVSSFSFRSPLLSVSSSRKRPATSAVRGAALGRAPAGVGVSTTDGGMAHPDVRSVAVNLSRKTAVGAEAL